MEAVMQNRILKASEIAVTVVLMLLTCEVATRLFSRIPQDVSMRDPLVGRRFEPGLNELVYNEEAGQPILLRTNQLGFRGDDYTPEKPPGVRRIAVLGDSYTAAMALPEDQTFCGQLQQMLNTEFSLNCTWQVMNFGIYGSGTGQELALYRHVVRKLQPDIVIVAFGNATDIRDNSAELTSNPIIQYRLNDSGELEKIPQSNDRIRLSNILNNASRFYSWQKMKVKSLKLLWQEKTDMQPGRGLVYAAEELPEYSRAWDLTSALFRVFRQECEADGCRLMVAAIPSAHQIHRDHFEELKSAIQNEAKLDPLHPDRRLETACRIHNIPFLSLTQNFRKVGWDRSYREESHQLFFGGTGHFNERGSRMAAEQMSKWLTTTLVAEKVHQPQL